MSYPRLRVVATAAIAKGNAIKFPSRATTLPTDGKELKTLQMLFASKQFTVGELSGIIVPSKDHPWVYDDESKDVYGERIYKQVTACALQVLVQDDEWVTLSDDLVLKALQPLTRTSKDALYWIATVIATKTTSGTASLNKMGSVFAGAPSLDQLLADLGGSWRNGAFVLAEPRVTVTGHTDVNGEKTAYEINSAVIWYIAADGLHAYFPPSSS
ncbi:hypothetical protein EOL96_04790 [Candidatus Saccharibacteria bacterium]|nr:hypothetical protein [Candidatus Saccharibacteria bacterium]